MALYLSYFLPHSFWQRLGNRLTHFPFLEAKGLVYGPRLEMDFPLLVADNLLAKAKGFMFSKEPKNCRPILFTASKPHYMCFWMANVSFPVGLFFLERDVEGRLMFSPEYYTMKPHDLSQLCGSKRYVAALELPPSCEGLSAFIRTRLPF